MLSDSRLPVRVTDAKKLNEPLEGRVLGHLEDERTGRAYMILEATDHNVHFIWHTTEIESARHQRKLGPNSFIRIDPRSANGRTFLVITDFGSSEQFLNTQNMRNRAQALVTHGIVPAENSWGGRLGRYDSSLRNAFKQISTGIQPESSNDSRRKGFGR
jgi:hypothetical protein